MALRFIILISLFILTSSFVFSQERSELEKKRRSLIKEIQYTNDLLKQNRQQKNLTLNQLAIINKKVNLRKQLIYQIENDLSSINQQILENQILIESLKNDLEEIKEEYAKLIYYAYKNKSSYDRVMFVFSAEDFNQAYRRLKYLQHYNRYRRKQAESIAATQLIIKEKIAELNNSKTEKTEILANRQKERDILNSEKNNQRKVVQTLSAKEKQLKKDLELKQKLAEELQNQIQKLIAEEIARSKKNDSFALTPEEKLIDDNFASNKTRLPWPIARGVITERFGVHPHPVLKGIKIKNDGVDISTNAGEIVRSVFKGEVRKIFKISGLNKTCIIRHGKYMTVYSNLDEVFVKVGEMVESKQSIGIVHTDKEEGIGTFKFQVWREFEKMNPEEWLAKQR
jgi:septal ring factor EnvC (AmiA/AmiB activator)